MSRLMFEIERSDERMNFNIWKSSVKEILVQYDESKGIVDKTEVESKSFNRAKGEEDKVDLSRQVR